MTAVRANPQLWTWINTPLTMPMGDILLYLLKLQILVIHFYRYGQACNGGFPGCCSDFPDLPTFFSLPEDTPTEYSIFTFEMNMDGINLSLEPTGAYPRGYLVLESQGNNNSIYLNHSLDLNVLNTPNLKVPITDEDVNCSYPVKSEPSVLERSEVRYSLSCKYSNTTNPASAVVFVSIVPVNTNPPEFYCAPYHKEISELTPVGTIVFRMTGLTFDPDIEGGIEMLYVLDNDYFEATNNLTGEIVTKQKLDYDHGLRMFVLQLMVRDRGGSVSLENWTTLTLTLRDADDQVPVFSYQLYTVLVPENNTDNISLETISPGRVWAYDLDYGINVTVIYYMAESNVPFTINQTTGEILPTQVLDREQNSSYHFQIQGCQVDDPITRTSFAFIYVVVEDINDNRPEMAESEYSVNISEHGVQGSLVVTVSAHDRDTVRNAKFDYHLAGGSGLFSIDPPSGVISVNNSDHLDREVNDTYIIQVYARETLTIEQWTSEVSQVFVYLSDINDNNPVFTSSGIYAFYSHHEVLQDQKLGKVEAEDADIGDNAEIVYTLLNDYTNTDLDHLLYIDPQSGWIMASVHLVLDVNTTLQLLVEARDQSSMASAQRHSYAAVDIIFINKSSTGPTLEPPTDDPTTLTGSTETTSNSCICLRPTTDAITVTESPQSYGFVIAIGMLVLIMMILLLIIIVLLLTKQNHLHKRVDRGSLTDPCHLSYIETASLVPNEEVHNIFSSLDDDTSTEGPSKCPTISTFSGLSFQSSSRCHKVDTGTNTDCSHGTNRDLFIQFEREPNYSEVCLEVVMESSHDKENKNHKVSHQSDACKADLHLSILQPAKIKGEEIDFSDCRTEEVIDIDIPCDSPRSSGTTHSTAGTEPNQTDILNTTTTSNQSSRHAVGALPMSMSNNSECLGKHSTWVIPDKLSQGSQEADLHMTEISLLDTVLSAEDDHISISNQSIESSVQDSKTTIESLWVNSDMRGKVGVDEPRVHSHQELDDDESCVHSHQELDVDESRVHSHQELDVDEPRVHSHQKLDVDEPRVHSHQELDVDDRYPRVHNPQKRQRVALDDICFSNPVPTNTSDSLYVDYTFPTRKGPITFL